MEFYCYIIYSITSDAYYVGSTGDELSERIRKHNSDHQGFTGGYGDWNLKHFEVFNSKIEAGKRERTIKKWKSRKAIERLINSSADLVYPNNSDKVAKFL